MSTTAKDYFTSIWQNERSMIILLATLLGLFALLILLCFCFSCCCAARTNDGEKDIEKAEATMKSLNLTLRARVKGDACVQATSPRSALLQAGSVNYNPATVTPTSQHMLTSQRNRKLNLCSCTIVHGPCHSPTLNEASLKDSSATAGHAAQGSTKDGVRVARATDAMTSTNAQPEAPPSYDKLMVFGGRHDWQEHNGVDAFGRSCTRASEIGVAL